MRYTIRVQDHLEPFWQARFDNLVIAHEGDDTTVLSGLVPDQAALYGILVKMRDLGLTLLSLEASVPSQPSTDEQSAKG